MLVPDLGAVFSGMTRPTGPPMDSGRFTALPIGDSYRLGIDPTGRPAILVSVASSGAIAPGIGLRYISVQHDVLCEITSPGSPSAHRARLTIIRCTSADGAIQAYFLKAAAPLLAALGEEPSAGDISRTVDRLAELFSALESAPRKSTMGLWAELLLIALARSAATAVSAWHADPDELYDFGAGDQRLEVKSASGPTREHHFTYGQLTPPPGTRLLVASLLIERAGGGVSLGELADRVRARLGVRHDLVAHADRVIALTLGSALQQALDHRYDYEQAKHSLAFYPPTAIPQIAHPLPSGVSDVHFRSDLTGCDPVDADAYRQLGGLFHCLVR